MRTNDVLDMVKAELKQVIISYFSPVTAIVREVARAVSQESLAYEKARQKK